MIMGNVRNLRDDFIDTFTSIQYCSGAHQKHVLKLLKYIKEVDCKIFLEEFKRFTNVLLTCDTYKKNPYVDKAVEFIAIFCYNLKQLHDAEGKDENVHEHEFLAHYVPYLLERSRISVFTIRLRCCQLINKILDNLVGTDLDTELCDQIEETLFDRLSDAKLEVRLEGIKALHRFQEKSNPLDRIIDMFKNLMEQDRFPKVRSLCIEKIALREDVVPVILSKIRDVDVGVRLTAFERLLKIPGALRIEQRRLLLKCASLDSSQKIQNFIASVLLPKWLQYFDFNFHSLMKAVRLDGNETDIAETNKLCEFMLHTLFKSKPLDELLEVVCVEENSKLIPYDNLNWESCNYWRILVQYIKKHPALEDEANRVLPELIHFCKYIRVFCENIPEVESTTDFLENQFIIKQLFTITKGYDISDPIGRSTLKNLVWDVLYNVILVQDTVQVILSNLEPILPNIEKRAIFVNELISEIKCPDDTKEVLQQEEQDRNELDMLKNECSRIFKCQEAAINRKDYDLAGSLQKDLELISEKKDVIEKQISMKQTQVSQITVKQDKATLIKTLDIAAGFLLSPLVTRMTSSLETLKSDTIFELLIHEDATVQSKALLCYALLCIIDKKSASDGIHLFSAPIFAYQSGQECDLEILLTCIGAVVDLLRIYGTRLVASPEVTTPELSESLTEDHQHPFYGGTSLTKIIRCLVDLIDDEEIQVRETSGRGLCSLIISNTIQSPSLLSKIVLKWCNPYEASQKLKQIIGITLLQMPRMCGFHQQWDKTIILTLKNLANTPVDGPHSEIKPEDIAKFMLTLYEANTEDHNTLMLNLALSICSEIRRKPRAKQVFTLSKTLIMLKVTKETPIVEDLLAICDELQDLTRNRFVQNNLIKFVATLNKIKGNCHLKRPRTPSDSESEEEKMEEVSDNE